MSDDLIRRSDAIEAIEVVDWYHQNKNKDMVSGANSDEHQAWYKADDIYKALEAIPTIEPKRGEWVLSSDGNGYIGNPVYKCTVCGWWDEEVPYNFCPNCGARMK